MYRKSSLRLRERGSVLPLVMIAIVLAITVGVGMLRFGVQARVFAARTSHEIAAQAAADAGLTKALWVLNQNVEAKYAADALPRQTDRTLDNSDATYAYEVTVPANGSITFSDSTEIADTDPFTTVVPYTRRYAVKCVGTSGNARKTVYATFVLKGFFDSALLSKSTLSLSPNTLVTGYNSADPTDTDIDVKVGTTGTGPDTISLSPGTVIEGDVFVGVGGNPDSVIGTGGTITGCKFALTEPVNFPVVTPPELPDFGTVIEKKGGTVTKGPADSGIYRDIKLASKAGLPGVLEIDGGDVVLHLTGKIDLGNGAEIVVKEGSSLVLYIDGDIAADNEAGFVNENPLVATLKIIGTAPKDQTFELKAKSSVFGGVYAPNADVELYPGVELCGSISARSVSVKSKGIFKYDKALKNVKPTDDGAHFAIEKWWE